MSSVWEICGNKDKLVLGDIMLNSPCPRLQDFSGVYMVRMLTGPIPDFSHWKHRKIITSGEGFNVFCQETMWGYFWIKYDEVEGIGPVVVFDYDHEYNGFVTRRIRDYVRQVVPGLYIGTFNYLLNGLPRFVGYFLLSDQRRQLCQYKNLT